MARWDPDGRERLARAALELFAERGYEATTVADVAQRAGLTKSTFFRHFEDKRAVLFAGQEPMVARLAQAARTIPRGTPPLDAVAVLLDALVDFFPADQRGMVSARAAVIAAHPELRERELLKREQLLATIEDALRSRAVDEITAHLAATMALVALETAVTRWAAAPEDSALGDQLTQALSELAARASQLGQPA